MPTYLCHGFRWQRRSIRVFAIVQNLDDASPDWLIPARSSQCILESFYSLFDFLPYCVPPPRSGSVSTIRSERGRGDANDETPRTGSRSSRSRSHASDRQSSNVTSTQPDRQKPRPNDVADASDELQSQNWSRVKLLEEYDPGNLEEVSRPYAYVADHAVRVDSSMAIFEEIAKYEEQLRAGHNPPITGHNSDEGLTAAGAKKKSSKKGIGWFEKLRDELQKEAEIRWYIVVNGDEVRDYPEEREPRATEDDGKRPSVATLQQHHSQYLLQQQIFEENDNRIRARLVVTDRLDKLPSKELPVLQSPTFVEAEKGARLKTPGRPKTPGKSGFRRLFGRSKTEDLPP